MEKQQYQSPRTKVVEVQQRQVLCVSNGTFGVDGDIKKGDDKDWVGGELGW